MHCDHARQLFDAYLDGELSAGLATELGAHRLHCEQCRHELALMEVAGHIIASDPDASAISDDFTERLLACVSPASAPWKRRMGFVLYVGVPLAAAAVVALAFLGGFDPKAQRVAGQKDIATTMTVPENGDDTPANGIGASGTDESRRGNAAQTQRRQRIEENWEAMRQSGDSLQKNVELTILQLLELLNGAREDGTDSGGNSLSPVKPPTNPDPTKGDDLEDL